MPPLGSWQHGAPNQGRGRGHGKVLAQAGRGRRSLENHLHEPHVAHHEVEAFGPEEPRTCPLCIENLDETELDFYPCRCGYQVCLFCYDRLKKEYGAQCPKCRTEYGDPVDPSEVIAKDAVEVAHKPALTSRPRPAPPARPIKVASVATVGPRPAPSRATNVPQRNSMDPSARILGSASWASPGSSFPQPSSQPGSGSPRLDAGPPLHGPANGHAPPPPPVPAPPPGPPPAPAAQVSGPAESHPPAVDSPWPVLGSAHATQTQGPQRTAKDALTRPKKDDSAAHKGPAIGTMMSLGSIARTATPTPTSQHEMAGSGVVSLGRVTTPRAATGAAAGAGRGFGRIGDAGAAGAPGTAARVSGAAAKAAAGAAPKASQQDASGRVSDRAVGAGAADGDVARSALGGRPKPAVPPGMPIPASLRGEGAGGLGAGVGTGAASGAFLGGGLAGAASPSDGDAEGAGTECIGLGAQVKRGSTPSLAAMAQHAAERGYGDAFGNEVLDGKPSTSHGGLLGAHGVGPDRRAPGTGPAGDMGRGAPAARDENGTHGLALSGGLQGGMLGGPVEPIPGAQALQSQVESAIGRGEISTQEAAKRLLALLQWGHQKGPGAPGVAQSGPPPGMVALGPRSGALPGGPGSQGWGPHPGYRVGDGAGWQASGGFGEMAAGAANSGRGHGGAEGRGGSGAEMGPLPGPKRPPPGFGTGPMGGVGAGPVGGGVGVGVDSVGMAPRFDMWGGLGALGHGVGAEGPRGFDGLWGGAQPGGFGAGFWGSGPPRPEVNASGPAPGAGSSKPGGVHKPLYARR